MANGGYYTAQICQNGHVITSILELSPERQKKFCQECGSETVAACHSCDAVIKGGDRDSLSISAYISPKFCDNCGKPHPWTELGLKASKELADELDGLTQEDKELLKKSIDEIVRETPKTVVASTRFKRIAAKGGREAADGLKQILIGVVSETAKKVIWP